MNRLFSRADWTRQKFLLPANGSAHICTGDMQYNASTYESAAAVPRFQQQVPLPISSSIITRKNRRCSLSLASSEKQKHPAIESVAGSLSHTRVPCASRGKRNEGLRRTVRIPCLASAWPPKDQSGKTRKASRSCERSVGERSRDEDDGSGARDIAANATARDGERRS